jgi:formate dehydrogenase maturation protein FdhE
LQALAEAESQDERLSTYYAFHRTLLQVLSRAKAGISATLELAYEEALQARVDQGQPLVAFGQLPVEEHGFSSLVSTVAKLLIDYDSDLAQQTVFGTPAECVALAQRRFEENQLMNRQSGEQGEPSLTEAAVDLALRPYLEWAAEQVVPYVEQGLWRRGYCPVCGGAPDFAALDAETGARHLLCSRCNSQWLYHRLGCPFCGTTEYAKLFYYPDEDGVYRLYVCQGCRRYLKTIDLREVQGEVLLPVERITTVAMDAAARSEGYT